MVWCGIHPTMTLAVKIHKHAYFNTKFTNSFVINWSFNFYKFTLSNLKEYRKLLQHYGAICCKTLDYINGKAINVQFQLIN